ncbi:uncharacterized protein isoform X2 [Danio rerio]|uniref:Uncharacterized protein isoform X2 n=2 Tax=Danio rerio TaxID=7955 RepID=A0AC58G8Y4_DANRE
MSDLGERPMDDRVNQQLATQPSVRSKVATETSDAVETELRRGKRTRKLTEKGQKLQEEKLERYEQRFKVSYDKWKSLVKEVKWLLSESSSIESLQDVMARMTKASAVVGTGYEDLRHLSIPDHDTRRRVDHCEAVTKKMEVLVKHYFEGNKEMESGWSDIELSEEVSVGTRISRTSTSSQSKSRSSKFSSLSAAKKQEAAAEVAANEATLEVLKEQDRQFKELQKLEAEDKKRIAEQEADDLKRREEEAKVKAQHEVENAARRKLLEDKRRELERLETVKKLNAAKARMQIYEQSEVSEDDELLSDLSHDCEFKEIHVDKRHHRPDNLSTKNVTLQPTVTTPQIDNTSLVKALTESMSVNRLPVPEPMVFNGDPLKFNDWKTSFQMLIEKKSIPAVEKIFYLRRYVGDSVKKALEGHFLLGTDSAYCSAWKILEERYGNPFLIAKSFREKLYAWPKIGPKESLELQEFVDFLRSCEAAIPQIKELEVLNDCNENQKILAKLPDWLTSRWNREVMETEENTKTFPSFSQFVKFLTKEAKIVCNPITSLYALKSSDKEGTRTLKTRSSVGKVLATNSGGDNLVLPGHQSRICQNRSVCDICAKNHPTCLHEDRSRSVGNHGVTESFKKSTDLYQHRHTRVLNEATSNQVMQEINNTCTSSIIPVWVSTTSEPEKEVLVYALLDTQSDTTFILEETTHALNVKKEAVQLKLATMASKITVVPCFKMKGLQVRGFYSKTRIPLPTTYSREFVPASKDHIPTPQTARVWPHLEHIADVLAPRQGCDVGLLIGYNCPQALLPREVVAGEGNQPFAQRTDLGWSVIGHGNPCVDSGDIYGTSHQIIVRQVMPSIPASVNLKTKVHYVCRTQIKEVVSPIDVIRVFESDFCEQESEDCCMSQEDLRFLGKMKAGTSLNKAGHYEMPLPFKGDRPNLPNNKVCAVYRLKCLARRFKKDMQYYSDYTAFMNEIIACGDAEKVPPEEAEKCSAWYIPHHGVYHPKKPGKIRVVFDCSARFQGTSLNDHLLTGPELTNTLVGVLCRFRKNPVAIMCDIERMFHQFHVKAEDRDYLRFLWWDNGNLEAQPSVYKMKVHLFGAASSPGCANYGLKHLAAEGKGMFTEDVIRFIQRNFYVDDGLVSVPTEAEAIALVTEAKKLCSTGKLRLHKFISNSKNVIASIPQEDLAKGVKDLDLDLGEMYVERALGVQWSIASDEFQFRVIVKEHPFTRRGVLSTIASVFDPLGFMAPFILVGKKILQQLCYNKASWDDSLPEDLQSRWERWLLDLPNLADVKIPRCYVPQISNEAIRFELHHFSDASISGYGECSYLRTVSASGEVHCSFVMGKSRVAPTKITTIPRLELSAAVVAVRVSDMLKKELDIKDLQECFWIDSKVVLGYINNDARRFQVFVANRVQRIKLSTESNQWKYVGTEDNPADSASRGLMVEQLVASSWLKGPKFLWQKDLPSDEVKVGDVITSNDPELRKVQVFNIQANKEKSLLERLLKFSDWARMVKAIARLKRYVREAKGFESKAFEPTTLEQRKDAELFIIRLVQEATFSHEMTSLKKQLAFTSDAQTKSQLYKLSPFLDNQGILRVGGRLANATLHLDVKYPAILPRKNHFSALLIKHYHERVQHQGRGMTVNELRSNGIWILGCSSAVSSHIYKCLKCRKFRRCVEEQKMADLPEDRVQPTPPFLLCGMDCFGPFYVTDGRRQLKRYGLLLTCMCSRAIHIEMLDALSTDAFINALRSFIAIRGTVRQIRCDQGTNFVGASREFMSTLKTMDQGQIKKLGCELIMNIPSASHMGGVWERQIRTVRNVLTSVLDQCPGALDSTSLRTLLYEVMAIVNSRPLTVEHLNDPLGPEPLTPNHILTMKSMIVEPPPGEFVKEDLYLRKRWRKVQYLVNNFWSRWRKEYLLNLQQRQKWNKNRRNVKVNDIVILKDDVSPRNKWKLAKVVDVYQGKDGKVRQVKLLMSDSSLDGKGKRLSKPSYLERPIQKVVILLEAD